MSDNLVNTFNLLDEPWIQVINDHGKIALVGLIELFDKAHVFSRIAGECKTQDIALLRLLLSILHAVYGRQEAGEYMPIQGLSTLPNEPLDYATRWSYLYNNHKFDTSHINDYLERYRDRFWLFHSTRPFYQIPAQEPIRSRGTYCGARKLMGTISEGSNKIRLFTHSSRELNDSLTFAEAARWLIHLNGFDDTALKPVASGRPGPGVGWLGKLGLVACSGANIFESLMLNLTLLPDGGDRLWGVERPIWACDTLNWSERTPISVPDNPSELYTLQSRLIHLDKEEDRVKGYWVMGGHFYQSNEEWFNEQMTLWRRNDVKKSQTTMPYQQLFSPKRHRPERMLWRDLSAFLAVDGEQKKAGIVAWLELLQDSDIDLNKAFFFETAAINYKIGSPSNDILDIFSDSLGFSSHLLLKHREPWRVRILEQVAWTDMLVTKTKMLAKNLLLAEGESEKPANDKSSKAMTEAYFRLDIPFRNWLGNINPDREEIDETMEKWQEKAREIVLALGQQMVANSGPKALVGRYLTGKGNSIRLLNAPQAFNLFKSQIMQK